MSDVSIRIVEGRIDVESLIDEVATVEDGGITVFMGRARAQTSGRPVRRLEYEAYVPMAETEMGKVVQRARQTFGVERLGVVHRIGLVPLGEAAVVVVAAAPHRDASFKACRFIIDEVKKTVPIWKNEFFEDGSVWVGDPDHPNSP